MNILKATKRNTVSSGQINKLRAEGFIPAILYGGKENNLKDPRFVRNIFDHIWLLMKCEKKKLDDASRLGKIIEDEFGKSMDIFNFIKRQ